MARLTVAEARTALAELLQIFDVEGSPEMVATINRALAAAQRTLSMRERWMLPTKRTTFAGDAGRTLYPMPAALEDFLAVGWQDDPTYPPRPLAGGIALDDAPSPAGVPCRYDRRGVTGVVSVTVGAGGSGYTNGAAVTFDSPGVDGWPATGVLVVSGGAITGVTITDAGGGYTSAPTVTAPGGSSAVLTAVLGDAEALVVVPAPIQGGTLVVDYNPTPPLSLADGDRLIMDEMAVIYAAAIVVAPAVQSPRASTIPGEATEYLKGLRGAGRAGSSFGYGTSAPEQARPGMFYRNGRWWSR